MNVTWHRNAWNGALCGGWQLRDENGAHLGTVFADGSWYCITPDTGSNAAGSQPLAAQALLRAAGVEP